MINPSDQDKKSDLVSDYLDADDKAKAKEISDEIDPAELALQEQIDEAICRHFGLLPEVETTPLQTSAPCSNPVLSFLTQPVGVWHALAACIVLGLGIGLYFLLPSGTTPSQPNGDDFISAYGPTGPPMTVVEIFNRDTASDFTPQFVCESNAQFAQVTGRHLRQPLMLEGFADEEDQVEVVGWSYENVRDPNTMYLLASVDGQPILLFFEYQSLGGEIPPPNEDAGLFLHQRKIGSVTAYELSPAPAPALLDRLYIPTD